MPTRLFDLQRMLSSMDALRESMNYLSGDYYATAPLYERTWGFADNWPKLNLYDTGDQIEVKVELPGFAKEDIQIKVQGNYLELSGTRKTTGPNGYTAHRQERETPTFTRSITLPIEVDSSKATASIKDGILHLILPKSAAARPQQITIR